MDWDLEAWRTRIKSGETIRKRQNNGSDSVNYLRKKSEAKLVTSQSELQLQTQKHQLQHERQEHNDQLLKKRAIINTTPATKSNIAHSFD